MGRVRANVIVGVTAGLFLMEERGIRPIPDEERLDMSHYPKEFIEFFA